MTTCWTLRCYRCAMKFKKKSHVVCGSRRIRIWVFPVIVLLVIIAMGIYNSYAYTFVPMMCDSDSQTGALPPTDKSVCIQVSEKQNKEKLSLDHKLPLSSCKNILTNLTVGRWVPKKISNFNNERNRLDRMLEDFRVLHEGFSKLPFREDKKCGFKQAMSSPICSMLKVDSSAWCDPYGSTPCCSNRQEGTCVTEKECLDQESTNLAQYTHAELARWQPKDKRCKWVEYNQITACNLLHQKKIRKITFIGNSLMRNMYSVFLQMLTNNYHNGSVVSCMPPSMREKCTGPWQNMDKYCLGIALAPSSEELPSPGICNGQLQDFSAQLKMFYLASFGNELKEYAESELDHENSYLLVGIGIHDQYKTDTVVDYLKPAMESLNGHKWPKLIWIHTVKTGLFKPPQFTSMHGTDEDIQKYIAGMNNFCHSHNIATIDLTDLTTGVWSVEGTHFGTAVNLMKLQFFLNYLSVS